MKFLRSCSYTNLLQIFKLIILSLLLAILFAELYDKLNYFIKELWLCAAIVNTLISIILVIYAWKNSKSLNITPSPIINIPIFNFKYTPYLLSGIFIITVFLLALVSSLFGNVMRQEIEYKYWLFVLWIPVIEEIVFRFGVGNMFKHIGGVVWGSYFSALTFALIHSGPTVLNTLQLQIFLPIGPFLLGLICEFLYSQYGKIQYPIIFHMCCNLSVIIFYFIDARWINWLEFLYQ